MHTIVFLFCNTLLCSLFLFKYWLECHSICKNLILPNVKEFPTSPWFFTAYLYFTFYITLTYIKYLFIYCIFLPLECKFYEERNICILIFLEHSSLSINVIEWINNWFWNTRWLVSSYISSSSSVIIEVGSNITVRRVVGSEQTKCKNVAKLEEGSNLIMPHY